ncbi:MAG: CDP-6-deoxy-delta-3,4-glucoseen reductase [Rhodocyclaceae bacterium]
MSYTITVLPGGNRFVAPPGKSVLDAALDAGIALPYGCRNGACGSCKSRLVAGEIDYGEYQESGLSEAERRAGWALLCCARARSDLTIECREADASGAVPARKMPCRVETMRRLAPDVMLIGLRLPANERMQFRAGQYVEFVLEGGARRAFSIANAPHDDALLELHVRRIPGGRFTGHVFESMRVRDILRIEGPLGSFFLREDSGKPLILLAGGTGFAPIKAIVEHAIHRGIARPMTLYWGARRPDEFYLRELPERWARSQENFAFVPVLSEPRAGDAWGGRCGLVHEALMEDFPDLSGHQVYASGAPAMIAAARRDLVSRCGLPEGEFFADAFTFAAAPHSPR